jgi:hypothetical protein
MKSSFLPTLLLSSTLLLPSLAKAERNFLSWGFRHDVNAPGSTQRGVAVAMDRRGYVAVTGYNDLANDTWYTARHDPLTGIPLWQKTFTAGVGDDRPAAVATDSQGHVVVGGFSTSANQRDFYVIKYAALNGTVLWAKRYNNSNQNGNDEITALAVDGADNVIVTGKSIDSGKQEDFYTIKYSAAEGNVLWAKRYSTSFIDVPNAIALAPNGDVVVAGRSRVGSNNCYLTVRYSSATGDQQWAQTFDSNQNDDDEATSVAVTGGGSVLVTGLVRMVGGSYAYHTMMYHPAGGNPLWSRTYTAPGGNNKTNPHIAVDSFGNALITGTANLDNFRTVYYAAKYHVSNGNVLWANHTDAPVGSPANTLVDDKVSAMVVDAQGNVIVTGTSRIPASDNDFLTVKFRATDGRLLWQQRLNGDADKGSDTAAAVAVDAGGDVAVTGTTRRGSQNNTFQMTTVRYQRFLLAVGDPVSGPGLSPAASISALSDPATLEDGSIVTRIKVKDGSRVLNAILPTANAGNTVSALQGQLAPYAGTTTFATFSQPVNAPNGSYAFVASLKGAPTGQTTGVWTTCFNGNLQLALQTGKQVPGMPEGVLLRSVINLSQGNSYLAALVTLRGTGVTTANRTALITLTSPTTGYTLLRTGSAVNVEGQNSLLRSIHIFTPPASAKGHGRYLGSTQLVARITLADQRTALVSLFSLGSLKTLAVSGGTASNVVMGAQWKSFGLPVIGSSGSNVAALATLQTGIGGVTSANDSAIVYASTINSAFLPLAAEGGSAPSIMGAVFSSFKDPVSNNVGRYAFFATVKGTGVSSSNQAGLWFGQPGALGLMARTGSPAPDAFGMDSPRRYASLKSLALPGGSLGRPLFLAGLSGPGVTTASNTALFGLDTDGYMRQLLRTGDRYGPHTLRTFKVLAAASQAQSASRSFNNNGSVTALATFNNLPPAILRVGIP